MALATLGCGHFSPPVADSESPAADACATGARIEDGEDGDDRTLVRGGRGGYIYTYVDENGSRVEPAGEFRMARGGASGSARALRIAGVLADGGSSKNAYAGVGFSFTEPKSKYDATRYDGIAFVARAAKPVRVRLKLPDGNTEPAGGRCSDCYNDFGVDFEVTTEWTRYQASFADLKQEADWGAPRPDAIDPSALYGAQWQVTQKGEFDLWIDDVEFSGCP